MYFFFFLYNLVKVEYNNIHGGKLSIENLRLYLEMSRGKQAINQFFGNKEANFVECLFLERLAWVKLYLV